MITAYLWIKLFHIVSATILFGTGLGTAFFMLKAYLSRSDEAMAVTTRHVVSADTVFTTPAVAIQLVTGLWLTRAIGIPYDSAWFLTVIGLFVFVGACWLPVVWIQIRIRDLLRTGAERTDYAGLMKAWVVLGVLAFSAVLALFYLMVFKLQALPGTAAPNPVS